MSTEGPTLAGSRSVCVLGMGYIGLPTASVLARRGHHVLGVDVRQDVVETINRGEIHIHEPLLDDLVRAVVAQGKLRAALAPQSADVFFICVPTPITPDHEPDLSYVEAAARSIRQVVGRGSLIILESTSPPGTTEDVVVREAIPDNLQVGRDVFVAHCPERVLPGHILREVIENDRVVGGVTPACTRRAVEFFEDFVTGDVVGTTAITAEMTKLIENSYRDVNIAFANELSMLAEQFDADPFEIISLANRHPRVQILTPGPGVGGHCISVDPWFVVHAAPERTPLLRAARNVNDAKPSFVAEQVIAEARGLDAPVIGCLGLTYKAEVDDLRESPSLEIVQELIRREAGQVIACDPYVRQADCPDIPLTSIEDLLRRSDILVLLTDHELFRNLPATELEGRRIVDTRGVWRERIHTAKQIAAGNGGSTVATPNRRAA